jgi:hypothetical protein
MLPKCRSTWIRTSFTDHSYSGTQSQTWPSMPLDGKPDSAEYRHGTQEASSRCMPQNMTRVCVCTCLLAHSTPAILFSPTPGTPTLPTHASNPGYYVVVCTCVMQLLTCLSALEKQSPKHPDNKDATARPLPTNQHSKS